MALDLSKLENVKQRGTKTIARCPACKEDGSDKKGDHLFIDPDGAFGCVMYPGDKDHRRRIASMAGLPENGPKADYTPVYPKKIAPESPRNDPNGASAVVPLVPIEVASYVYVDAESRPIYEVVRYEPGWDGKSKGFKPFLMENGTRNPFAGIKGVRRYPYQLPAILLNQEIWIVEGEKNADDLIALNICATTRAGGSSAWEPELVEWFKGKDIVFCGDNDEPGIKFGLKVEAALSSVARSFRIVRPPAPHNDISDALEGLSDEDSKALIQSLLVDPLESEMAARRFDISKPPVRTEPVLWINDVGIAKPGDLVVIQAQVKSGKSSLLAAMMGCLMGAGRDDCDFLGVRGCNPQGYPVLHIDTEQTPEDHYDLVTRTLARAKLSSPPSWLYSYCLTDFGTAKRRKALAFKAKRLVAEFGGISLILVDGVGDICVNVNDPAESNDLVDELYSMAIHCKCPLIGILHENHGTESGKTRGHLGSQLERKAASNLRLSKGENGVIQLWGEKLRRGHIAKDTGPHFIWSDEQAMHITCETTKSQSIKLKDKKKVEKWFESATDIFSGNTAALRHVDFVASIMKRDSCSEATAKRRIDDMRDVGLVRYSLHFYQLNHDFVV